MSYSFNALIRAAKDATDRVRAAAKAEKRIADGTASQAFRHGSNRYFTMDSECHVTGIDESKISEEEKWDVYYAVITDNENLSSDQVMSMYTT